VFSQVIKSKVAVASVDDELPTGWSALDCRVIIDGPGNPPSLIDELVSSGMAILAENGKVCCVCDFGHSRSNLIAAGMVMKLQNVGLAQALEVVSTAHPQSYVKPSLTLTLPDERSLSRSVRTVAVTGASGLIGPLLVEQLNASGLNTVGMSRGAYGDYLRSPDDLTNLLRSLRVTDIVHLAYPRPYNSYRSTREAIDQLSVIIEVCIAASIRLHFVSGWVVFDSLPAAVAKPDIEAHPHSLYAQAKSLQERFVMMQVEHGLSASIYRLPGIVDLTKSSPRVVRYLADCRARRSDITIHEYLNGTSVLPLVELDDCILELCEEIGINSGGRPEMIRHVASSVRYFDVAKVATGIASVTGAAIRRIEIPRFVFRGTFAAKDTTERTGDTDDADLGWSMDLVSRFG